MEELKQQNSSDNYEDDGNQGSSIDVKIEHHNYKQKIAEILENKNKNFENIYFSYLQKRLKSIIIQEFSAQDFKNRRCKNLKISNSFLAIKEIETLFQNKIFQNLVGLDISSNSTFINDDVVKFICKQEFRLKSFSSKNNKSISDNSLQFIQNSAVFQDIEYLDMDNCDVGEKGIEYIQKSGFVGKLKELKIGRNYQINKLQFLTGSFSSLQNLDIQHCHIFPEGIYNLAKNNILGQLRQLNISSCFIGEEQELKQIYEGLCGLCQEDSNIQILIMKDIKQQNLGIFKIIYDKIFQKNLKILDFENNSQIFKEIEQFDFQNIESLCLRNCNLDPQYLKGFLKQFRQLKSLDLSENKLRNQGLMILMQEIKQKQEIQLEKLYLGACELTIQEIDMFVNNPQLQNLKFLYLRENEILDEGLQIFVQDTCMNNLEFLNFSGCSLTLNGFQTILSWSGLQSVIDLRLSENIKEYEGQVVYDIILDHLDNIPMMKSITLGSAIDTLDKEVVIPEEITNRNIQVLPFFCDDLD